MPPTIVSFTGTWDSSTGKVTLEWRVDDIDVRNTVIKVGEGFKAADVDDVADGVPNTDTSRLMPSQKNPGTSPRYTLVVTDASLPGGPGLTPGKRTRTISVTCGARAVARAVVAEASLESPPFVNNGYHWLTYETVLNKPKFRKTNQSRQIGLYAAAMADLQIWVRDTIPAPAFDALCESFFPDHTPTEIKRLSYATWWWKQQQPVLDSLRSGPAPYSKDSGPEPPDIEAAGLLPESQSELTGSRAILKIHLPRYAVLPYNFWDNDEDSRALGSSGSNQLHPIPMIQVKGPQDPGTWKMWRTASRSCVMELSRVKDAFKPWPKKDWNRWDFDQAVTERVGFGNKNPNRNLAPYTNQAFVAEVANAQHFQLSSRTDYVFSVKTGVSYVGVDVQREKEIVGVGGEWFVGCMRSDTINAIEQLAQAKGARIGKDIVVQTEIMMVLERRISPEMKTQKFGAGMDPGVDGVALRDLTVLDNSRFYIPPLSIPFIHSDMGTLTEEFSNVDDPQWTGFWKRYWAEALGRAKALFLIQYGMQTANPNVQNYLIEFARNPQLAYQAYVADSTPVEPIRVVIRDVADALLVREVAWALFGPPGECPSDIGRELSAASAETLAKMSLPVLRYNFKNASQGSENETGSTNEQFGTPGVQFLWHRFSAFYVGHKPGKNGECPPLRLPRVLQLACDWGIAHSAAYIRTVEKALGTELPKIRWDQLYDEEHHPNRYVTSVSGLAPGAPQWEVFSKADLAWEEEAVKVLQIFLRSGPGRTLLCDYHNRGWVDATPRFRIRVVDSSARPKPLCVVFCSRKSTQEVLGTRITDGAGEIPFFDGQFADFTFWITEPPLRKRVFVGGEYMVGTRRNLEQQGVASGGLYTVTPEVAAVTFSEIVVADPGIALSGPASRLTATATAAASASITSVRFLLKGNPLSTPVTGAYETALNTTTLKNGPYQVTAAATDSQNVTTNSVAVTVTVRNPPPTVTITAPSAGDISGTVSWTADAAAGAGMTLRHVQFQLDGKNFGSPVPGSPFSASLNASTLKNGDIKLTAIAEDTAGNTATSDIVTVKVTNALPTVQVTSPIANATVGGTFDVTAEANAGAGMTLESVQFKINGADYGKPISAVPSQSLYTVTAHAAALKNGNVAIIAVAKDTAGNMTSSAPLTVQVGNAPPTISFLPPSLSGSYVSVVANVTPGAGMTLQGVKFLIDDAQVGRLVTARPFMLAEYQLLPGVHTIAATVLDTAGNSASTTTTVTVP